MRVLVTGGSGFVGRAVVADLVAHGHEVVATTRGTGDAPHWITWNAAHSPAPDVEWSAFDAVLHLASPTGPVDATSAVLEQARAAGVARFVYVSSGDALGAVEDVVDESTPVRPAASPYGAAKAAGEAATLAAAGSMSTAVVRLFHPYGPGGDRFLVNRVVRAVADGTPVTVEGDHGLTLNPAWVADVAVGLRLALESLERGVFHLAGPEVVTLAELLTLAGELCGREPVVERVPGDPPGGHAGRFEETTRRLGYRPSVTLRDGVGRLLRSFAAPTTGR